LQRKMTMRKASPRSRTPAAFNHSRKRTVPRVVIRREPQSMSPVRLPRRCLLCKTCLSLLAKLQQRGRQGKLWWRRS
ncbi:hypothetical protein LTS18_002579, partial [Coniosporium uncinatum]